MFEKDVDDIGDRGAVLGLLIAGASVVVLFTLVYCTIRYIFG